MDWQALVHDRRFQLAAGAVAAVGGYVWWRRKSSAAPAGAGSSQNAATAGAAYQQAGSLDTSGTDIANWLGQYSGSLQNQLDAYQQSLQDAIHGLGQTPTSGSSAPPTGGTGGTWSGPAVVPVASTPATVTRPFVTVVPYTRSNTAWNSTLSGIAAHSGVPLSRLEQLNPSITNPNVIHPGQRIYTG